MYAKHFIRDIEVVSIPPQPIVNSVIQYRRCGRLITGKLIGTHWYQIQRYSAVVCEYVVIPDRQFSNLSFHVVQEDDIVWQKPAHVCPRCQGIGYIAIRNGCDDVPCPVCGDSDEVTF